MPRPGFEYHPIVQEFDSPYGVQMGATGECDGYTVEAMVNGVVVDIEPKGKTALLEGLEQIKIAVNRMFFFPDEPHEPEELRRRSNNLDEWVSKLWWEHGLTIESAMDTFPHFFKLTDEELAALREAETEAPWREDEWLSAMAEYGMAAAAQPPSTISVKGNALPEITDITVKDSTADYERLYFDLLKQLGTVLTGAFQSRMRIMKEMHSSQFDFDVRTYRWLNNYIEEYVTHGPFEYNEDSMYVLMPVSQNDVSMMTHSLPKLLANADSAGKQVLAIVGLNDGAELPDELLQLESDNAVVTHLYVNESKTVGDGVCMSMHAHEDVYLDPDKKGSKYILEPPRDNQHRVYIVHQEHHEAAAGKNRLQRLFSRMMLDFIMHGVQKHNYKNIPRHVLLADADAWPYEFEDRDGLFTGTNGLERLFAEKDMRNLGMIAARSSCMQFDEDGKPSPEKPIHPVYQMLDRAHGDNMNIMIGGATLGDVEVLLPLLTMICHRYPGQQIEDYHYTLLAEGAGVNWGISEHVAATNLVREDSPLGPAQRWFEGAGGLAELYKRRETDVVDSVFRAVVDGKAMIQEARSAGVPNEAITAYQELVKCGSQNPRSPVSGDPSWARQGASTT